MSFRIVLFLMAFAITILALGAEKPLASSPQMLLTEAARKNTAGLPYWEEAAAWRDAGIRAEILTRFGLLLPGDLPLEDQSRLAVALQDSDPSHLLILQERLATFPKVDELVFDGQGYAGGNLSYIDAMLGKAGLPIAFDRDLPAMLVPLTHAAEAALSEKRAAFQANAETRKLREAADLAYGERASESMFSDGQFLRVYAERFDDLYFHLFQNGNGTSALAFCGLSDGLAGRVYRPLFGICRRDIVPLAGFDLDDILSGGGKAAVWRYLRTQAGPAIEPFQEFAFHVLPSVIGKARTLPAGARFTATGEEILRALRIRRHFYPTQVSPLYTSPGRFLGWTGFNFIPVANNPALPPGAADSWYPLPQSGHSSRAEKTADGAASDQLFGSSSTPWFVWEDPQLSNLLADPETRTNSTKDSAGRSSPPDSAHPGGESDPRLGLRVDRLIAVVTPTATEAIAYKTAIATSDEKLRAIEQTRGRIGMLRAFIESARAAFSAAVRGRPNDPAIERLQRAMAADLASFDQHESELAARVQVALQERLDLRVALENRLHERVEPLRALGRKPGEVEASEKIPLAL